MKTSLTTNRIQTFAEIQEEIANQKRFTIHIEAAGKYQLESEKYKEKGDNDQALQSEIKEKEEHD